MGTIKCKFCNESIYKAYIGKHIGSHDISDIEKLCKRVVIINDGQIVMDDSMTNLKYHYMDKKVIEVKLKNNVNFSDAKGIKILKEKEKSLRIEIDTNETDLTTVLKLIDPENIIDINISNTPLEEIISAIYRKEQQYEKVH